MKLLRQSLPILAVAGKTLVTVQQDAHKFVFTEFDVGTHHGMATTTYDVPLENWISNYCSAIVDGNFYMVDYGSNILKLDSCGINKIYNHPGGNSHPICAEHNGTLVFCHGKECTQFDPSINPLSEAFTPFANLNDYHYEGEMISLVRTDGNHLIAVGGTHNSITTTSELYDESSDTWKELGDLENLPYNYRDFDTIESEGKTLMFGGFAVEPSVGTYFPDESLELSGITDYKFFNSTPHPISDYFIDGTFWGPKIRTSIASEDYIVHSHHEYCVHNDTSLMISKLVEFAYQNVSPDDIPDLDSIFEYCDVSTWENFADARYNEIEIYHKENGEWNGPFVQFAKSYPTTHKYGASISFWKDDFDFGSDNCYKNLCDDFTCGVDEYCKEIISEENDAKYAGCCKDETDYENYKPYPNEKCYKPAVPKTLVTVYQDDKNLVFTEFNVGTHHGMATTTYNVPAKDNIFNYCTAIVDGNLYIVDHRQSIYKLESCGINEIFKHSISGGYPICAEHNGKLFFCYSKECAKFDPSVTPISDAFTPIAAMNDYHTEGKMINLIRWDGNHLIVVGGTQNHLNTTSELYDDSTDTWIILGELENLPYNYRGFDAVESQGKTLMFGGFAYEPSVGTYFPDESLELSGITDYEFFNSAPHPISDSIIDGMLWGPKIRTSIAFEDYVVHGHHEYCVHNDSTLMISKLAEFAYANVSLDEIPDLDSIFEYCDVSTWESGFGNARYNEIEIYYKDNGKWNGPFVQFAKSYPSSSKYGMSISFWKDDLDFGSDSCYRNLCDNFTCDDGEYCKEIISEDDDLKFAGCCKDETDNEHFNPYLNEKCYDPETTTTTTTTTTTKTTTTSEANVCDTLNIIQPTGKKYGLIKAKLPYPLGGISANTISVRYNFVSAKVWTKEYLGFLTFTQGVCGADFLKAISNGRVTFDAMDKQAVYDTADQHRHLGEKMVTIQFRHKQKGTIKSDYGNAKKDQVVVQFTGMDGVTFGNKNMMNCLQKAKVSMIKNGSQVAAHGKTNVASCINI